MKRILPVIVIAQFFCTSVWFAGNAFMGDIAEQFHFDPADLTRLSSSVQFGFIAGTLIFAILSIADKFSPVKVFFSCAIISGFINLGASIDHITFGHLMLFRFATGFFLAGIYPVGMKIASDHYQQGLGKSLGFLVGALVLGTAFPHLLSSMGAFLSYRLGIYTTSLLSALGGVAILLFVPDGPGRQQGQKLNFSGFLSNFKDPQFKAAAFGYFGHMWELYGFWVFVPLILKFYEEHNSEASYNVPLLSFLIIASGSISCVFSGIISQKLGVRKTAVNALLISCVCCLMSPLLFFSNTTEAFIAFMFVWSMAAVADSPLLSTLVAQNAPAASKGSALTIVNCIGFAITIVSIQFISSLRTSGNAWYIYTLLAIGPILGLSALSGYKETDPTT
ncbi:MFS transporter [Mucilaginibacter corticis]|uniref:MFS transporter n=1 Tax=Mucilaginibacter corticis TaxID=2597670 RepID=A0A556MWP7_9SPHI|nr:MFS transporter [Mucilaginibacter corticis]TSJ44337.1 MFS transporter [Mucilaginibacter corticis]